MSQLTVLEFLEETRHLPRMISVERAQHSKYSFYLLIRHYRKKLGRVPQFVQYEKKTAESMKSMMEEHSIFNDTPLYVLEGFNQGFVDNLGIPDQAYLVAETEGGTLKAEHYSYRLRKQILRVLVNQLNVRLTLRGLLSLDWSGCRSYEDFEVILRTAKIMEWTEEQLGERLKEMQTGQILTLLKRAQFKDIYTMISKYGPNWTHDHLMKLLVQVIHYKALKVMGYEEDRIGKELEVGYGRLKELTDSAIMLSNTDVRQLVQRLINKDSLFKRNPLLGLDLFLLNSPIKVRK